MSVELRIALLIGLFAIGFFARRAGWLTPAHAGRMLRLVITVGLPALFLATVSRIPLSVDIIAFPASSLLIILATLAVSLLVSRSMGLQRPQQGAMVVCSMSINNAFLFPFVLAGWGQSAFAQLALFDLGHIIAQGTFIYVVAAWFGGHGTGAAAIVKRVLGFPLLWALAVAIAINLSGLVLPDRLVSGLSWGGNLIVLLVIVALGVLFDARLLREGRVLVILLMRLLLGAALGVACVLLFGLEGEARAVVLLGAMAPIGFNAVVIAALEKLDRELAASAASISVLLGLVYVPLALWLLPR